MKYCLFLFLLLPAYAQLPPENSDLQSFISLPTPNTKTRNLAAALEVVYSTTDPTRHEVFYEAVVQANKSTEPGLLWNFFPNMKKAYKKNRALMVDDPYFKEAVSLNQALREAMKTDDLKQRQQNLHRIYSSAQYYTPTIVLIIETEWALGNHEVGDQLLADLNILEPVSAVWPILILNAKKTRRLQGIDAGLKALEQAEKLSKIHGNPVKKIRAAWEAEIRAAGTPEKMAELGAVKLLSKHAKVNPQAAYQLAKLHLEKSLLTDARLSLKKAISSDKNNVDFFVLDAQIQHTQNSQRDKPSLNKKTRAKAETLAAAHPKHAKLHWINSLNHKADDATRKANLIKAFELDPADDDIYNHARKLLTAQGANQDAMNVYEKRLEVLPDPTTNLIYLQFLIQIKDHKKALVQLERFLEQYPKNKYLYIVGAPLMVDQGADSLLKGHFAARMLEHIDFLIQTSDFHDAARLVDMMRLLYPQRKELDILQANIMLSNGSAAKAIELYETALADHPNHSALLELLGDSWLNHNKKRKALKTYERALVNKPLQKERLRSKIEYLNEQLGLFTASDPAPKAFIQGVGGMNFVSTKRFRLLGRALSTTAGGGWWGGSDIGGDAIRETSGLITPLYDYLLDLDLAWQDEQEG